MICSNKQHVTDSGSHTLIYLCYISHMEETLPTWICRQVWINSYVRPPQPEDLSNESDPLQPTLLLSQRGHRTNTIVLLLRVDYHIAC